MKKLIKGKLTNLHNCLQKKRSQNHDNKFADTLNSSHNNRFTR